jgi:Uma2 family endonuclease
MSVATKAPATKAPATKAPAIKATPPTETRILLTGVDWETFERLAETARGARFAFDRGALEIMTLGPLHESRGRSTGAFVRIVTLALGIPRKCLGSTTWKRPEAERGIEADDCFYFTPEKIAAVNAALARKSRDSTEYPVPDLAIEVDISKPQLDRPAIYATIRVAEVWRFVDDEVQIDQLREDGTYRRSRTSRFLPLTDRDIQRWLVEEDAADEVDWENRLTAWARRLAKSRASRRRRPKSGE